MNYTDAIPLASATVLGGAVANNILNAPKRHPDHPDRSCIDWDLILQMEPMTMAGALVGADLNDYLSDTLLILLLLVLLTFTAYKTLKKANKLHCEESEAIKQNEKQIELEIESTSLIKGKAAEELEYGTVAESVNGSSDSSSSDGLSVEKNQLAFQNAAKLTGLFAVVTLINLLKGGRAQRRRWTSWA
jgi:hypothetical protein